MQKNITFNPPKQNSERINRKNDSSSFLNNNTSTEFKMSYDKSLMSNNDQSRPASTVLINVKNNGKNTKNDQPKPKVNSL